MRYFVLVALVCILSCKNTGKESDFLVTDTLRDDEIDTPAVRSSVLPEVSLPQQEVKQTEDTTQKKVYGLTVVEADIVFDANFRPFVSATLKNEMKEGVIAFEMIVDANPQYKRDCERIVIKKNLSIQPGKTKSFKQIINEDLKGDCLKIEFAKVYVGDYVLSSGRKTNWNAELLNSSGF